MIVIGIDPGLSGALAMIDRNGLAALADMPVMARGAGGYVKRQVNGAELASLLGHWMLEHERNEIVVVLELVGAMPRQGTSSVFSLGLSAGIVEGVLMAKRLRHELVAPQVWKRAMKVRGPRRRQKELARSLAQRLYPGADLTRVKDHGRAEAILIARYGWQQWA